MKMQMSLSVAALALVGAGAVTSAAADVRRTHRFDAVGIEHLQIQYRAGEVVVEPSQGDEIEVELRLEAEGRGWFGFGRSPDLDDMEISERTHDDRLTLSFDEPDVSSHWVVRLPELSSLAVEGGVGDIDIRVPPMDVNVDLGVGSVSLELQHWAVGSIGLSAGVGNTAVDGTDDSETERAFVSSRSSAHGTGDKRVQASVGVGDVRARLR